MERLRRDRSAVRGVMPGVRNVKVPPTAVARTSSPAMLPAESGDPDRTVKSASLPAVREPLMPDVPVAAAAPVV